MLVSSSVSSSIGEGMEVACDIGNGRCNDRVIKQYEKTNKGKGGYDIEKIDARNPWLHLGGGRSLWCLFKHFRRF